MQTPEFQKTTNQRLVTVRFYRPLPLARALKTMSLPIIGYRLLTKVWPTHYGHCNVHIGGQSYDYDYKGLTVYPENLDERYRENYVDIPFPGAQASLVLARIADPFAFWNKQKPGLLGYAMGFNCVSFVSQALFVQHADCLDSLMYKLQAETIQLLSAYAHFRS